MIRNCMKRNVISISSTATIRQAAKLIVARHIGLLPVVNPTGKPVGVVSMRDLLTLELPDFFDLLPDLDFVHDFGAVENRLPSPDELDQPVTKLMQPGFFVKENSGLLRAYALMIKHNLHDLPVISDTGVLVGIASRVDIGVAILATWQQVEPSRK